MNIKRRTHRLLRTVLALLCGIQLATALLIAQPATVALADSAISGTVFQDYNANGVRDTNAQVNNNGQGQVSLAVDKGVTGVLVTAYATDGSAVGNATSDSNGTYQLTATGDGPYRLEFTNLPSGYQPGPVGANNGSTVRFIAGAATAVDLGIIIPGEYCQNNPQLVANCYRFGDASTGIAADSPTIVDFPYSAGSSTFNVATGALEPTTHALQIKVSQVGTTWGLAYARSAKQLYASAFYKKHSGFGPGGPGAIYVIDPATNSVVNTLSVPGATTNAHNTADYENDNGVIGFAATGKTSLGGIALSPDEKTLYVMNLETRTLVALDATTGALLASQAVPAQPPLVAPATVNACRPGDVRPFAVTYYQGKLYIGMVCSAESAPDADTDIADGDGNLFSNWGDVRELRLYVYTADPVTLAFSSQPVFAAPLNYPRAGAYGGGNMLWHPWTDDWNRSTVPVADSRMVPQPILSDITFENGNLMLGVRDRLGDQGGLNLPYGSSGTFQEVIMIGATLRACGDPQNGWTLEDNARCAGAGTQPKNTGHGPGTLSLTPPYTSSVGYGSYYNVHAFETHSGDSFGGLAWIPGHANFVNTGMRPAQNGNSGGIYWLNATSGSKTKGYQLYAGDDTKQPPYTFGKANGMGDVLVLCDAAPIEIGNRVWVDADGNGIQDANESGLDGVQVELYRANVKVGETTTANGGEYYFSQSNVTLNGATGIVPGTGTQGSNSDYQIRILMNQPQLNGLAATVANAGTDLRDSDGVLISNNVVYTIPFADLAGAGFNNHTFDFGFAEAGQVMSLGNRLWFDANNDGKDNDGAGGTAGSSTGIEAVSVQVFKDSNGNGVFDAGDSLVQQTTTDSNGCFAFSSLEPTTGATSAYFVVLPSANFGPGAVLNNYRNSSGEPATDANLDQDDDGRAGANSSIVSSAITLTLGGEPTVGNGEADDGACNLPLPDANGNQTVDFGFYTLDLGNQVWLDENNNGLLDNTEQGVDGVKVELLDEQGAVVQTTTTANGGFYGFAGFAPGIVQVRITAAAGMVSSTPDAGDPDVDSVDHNDNGNGSGGGLVSSSTFSIAPGSTNGGATVDPLTGVTSNPKIDFGLLSPLNLGNLVWQDRNNNGTVDVGESGIPNILVQIFRSSDNPATATPLATSTTTVNGIYSFTNLLPGQVLVCIPTPPAQFPTSSVATDSTDNGEDNDDNGIQTASGGRTCSPVITLTSGGEPQNDGDGANGDLTVDFGFFGSVSVGDRVWFDDNSNGLQDQGELGVSNVKVTLYDAGSGQPVTSDINGNAIQPVLTDNSGNYRFSNLPAGSYYVVFDLTTLPAGYQVSTPNVGSNNEIDSDANDVTGKTETVTVTIGSNLSLDMGIFQPTAPEAVAVGDRVWYDDNSNGLQDQGELGVKSVKVTLFDATTGQPVTSDSDGNAIQPLLTDGSGNYRFNNLPAGSYYVVFDLTTLPAGYLVSEPNVGSNNEIDSDANAGTGKTEPATILVGSNLSLDMGIFQPAAPEVVRVGDYVWFDDNHNGVQDGTEVGVAGVVVTLFDATTNQPILVGNNPLTRTTDNDGQYLFAGQPVGNYYVVFSLATLPSGYSPTVANAGGNDALDSDADANGKSGATAVLSDGAQDLTLDMGLFAPYSLGNRVWEDGNNNGVIDNGESGINGVTVNLFVDANSNGNPDGAAISTTLTANDGYYRFDGLEVGNYLVEAIAPVSYRSSTVDAGDPDIDVDDSDDNGVVGSGNSVRSATVTLGAGDSEPIGESDLVGGANPQGTTDARANMTVDFGFLRLAAIGDRVWLDINTAGNDIGDGIQDSNENGLAGWIVELHRANGTLVTTMTTDSNGLYHFTDLLPGDYFIKFVSPSQTQQFKVSPPDQGIDDAQDSDANPVTLQTPVTTLTPGEDDRTWDMGVFLIGTGLGDSDEPSGLMRVFLPVVTR